MRAVARPVRSIRLLPLIALVALSSACQSAMSVEEAKKVTAAFTGSFVPPPRTINDVTAVLDQQKLANPEAAAKARAEADAEPPKTTNPSTLAEFYFRRGLAARQTGRAKQEIEDLTRALEWVGRGGSLAGLGVGSHDLAWQLGLAETQGGNISRADAYYQQAIAATPPDRRGALIRVHTMLTRLYAGAGDFTAAEEETRKLLSLVDESRNWRHVRSEWVAYWNANAMEARGYLALATGRFAEAEELFREALAWLTRDPVAAKEPLVDLLHYRISAALLRQGRLLEAEKEARAGLLGALSKRGRNSTHTALVLAPLVHVIAEQGRHAEAGTLARALVDIYQKTGASEDSVLLAKARRLVAASLVAQGRWQEALAEFETIRRTMSGDPEGYQKYIAGDIDWALALLKTRQPDRALEQLQAALERSQRAFGPAVPEIRGLLAMARAAGGDQRRALRDFAEAIPALLKQSEDIDDESTTQPARDQRLRLILAFYIGLLADIKGTPLEREAAVDVAAEAFRLADVARGQSVQRALDASAARAAARTPALADLVRREQDVKKQISALHAALANALSQPSTQQDPKVLADLRSQIDTLRRARQALAAQIEKEFPAYAELINPKPVTVQQARATLRPGEALITTYVADDRTFVWAVPHAGPVAFAAAPLGSKALGDAAAGLRKALDPSAKTLGEIPEFDLGMAYKIFHAVLEPVRPGWERAESLLLVAHGPLGQLPFSLLPTKPATLGPEAEPLFANYRAVPWLVRTHAVTMLPSVSALATLRALPPGDAARRPFIGFGDPYFSPEQAARAAAREAGQAQVAALTSRGVPITLRSSPKTQTFDSSQLAMLPRLPDTADEIRSIALAMNADLTRDVFVGQQANEKVVKTLDLFGYRVVAFATHGLVPGDLDGLTQPALALTAPEVARVEGDGLLTMEEILGLRLNADWVVLSACNTASGQGAGSEAVSGLGRAFFYAGARALLVSNWPVETTSARELTTDLFRRQRGDPRLTRAQALQQTLNALIDGPGFADPQTKAVVFSYAHPIFWAPFTLIGDGGGN